MLRVNNGCSLIPSEVETAVKVGLDVFEKQNRNDILSGPSSVFLQIDFIKIPKLKRKIVRIPLPHSLLTETSDVCFFAADLVRGRNVNHEMTVNHYDKLLKKKGITDIAKIQVIPSRQVRVEYDTFEAKRKLCNSFDMFLIDDKINTFLSAKLGREFHKHRKWPIPLKMKHKDLKDEFARKLRKSCMALDGKGSTKIIQVGRVDMSAEEIGDNIKAVGDYIAKYFPGGWLNIRSFHIKTAKSISIPVYLSLVPKNDIRLTPGKFERPKKQKRPAPVTDELSILGKNVIVYPSGRVVVCKSKKKKISKKVQKIEHESEIDDES